MEKFSAFRDPGTGIHPFLRPVPPQGSDTFATLLKPLFYGLGLVRTLLVLILGLFQLILVQGVCSCFLPISYLHNITTHALTAVIARLVLFTVGIYWIPVEIVRRRRMRISVREKWHPKAGDVIITNWISWLEIVWLAFRVNPVYAIPVASRVKVPEISQRVSPGRKTGTGSAAISNRTLARRADISGFKEVSLLSMIITCGQVPPFGKLANSDSSISTFEEIRQKAKQVGRPLVLFPECTTSNGRGLLRFASMTKAISLPVKDFDVYPISIRIDLPTAFTPSLSLPIPSSTGFLSIVKHIFAISSTVSPHTISIRLLAPSESPSSELFAVSDVLPGATGGEDILMETCAVLISEIGRLKRTGMGWEDKCAFLEFYEGKVQK